MISPIQRYWLRRLPGSPLIVAEVKIRSPFGFVNPVPWQEQLALCEKVGDVVSVHTNELWGGSWKFLEEIRGITTKPILAKGFHPTIFDVKRAFDLGADHVLTVGWWPDDPRCWHEVESLAELSATKAPRAVWNSRDPRTGLRRTDSLLTWMQQAREARPDLWLCQASGIRKLADVYPTADAILIGEGLYGSMRS